MGGKRTGGKRTGGREKNGGKERKRRGVRSLPGVLSYVNETMSPHTARL